MTAAVTWHKRLMGGNLLAFPFDPIDILRGWLWPGDRARLRMPWVI